MPATYRIEICPNNRAGCKDPVCKGKAEKIKKGELRFASWVEYNRPGGDTMASWAYKHWGCVSGAQIGTLRELCDVGDGEYDYNVIDGYDEMEDHPEIQEKVRRCIQQGHIDPEDFKGDPEKNKPGIKGIHLTAKQKEKRDQEAAAAADGTASEEDTKKSKPKAKRSRKKVEDDEDDDEEPQPKKTKTAKGVKAGRKSGSKIKDESEDETVVPPVAKGRKSASKVKAETEPDKTEALPAAKKSRRSAKVKKEESEAEEDAPKPVETKTKRGRKSAIKAPTPESQEPDSKFEEGAEPEQAPKKKSRRASTNTAEDETVGEKSKTRRRSSRTAS